MNAGKEHLTHHRLHMLACAAVGVLVIVAIAFSIPVLAVLGALMCGAMMIALVWMMFSMASKRH